MSLAFGGMKAVEVVLTVARRATALVEGAFLSPCDHEVS